MGKEWDKMVKGKQMWCTESCEDVERLFRKLVLGCAGKEVKDILKEGILVP